MDNYYHPDWSRMSWSTGYPVVYCPDHPRAWSTGYIYVHVVVMEMTIGRLLLPGEIVHHQDEQRWNYSPTNLVITSRPAHARHHAALATVVDLICCYCGAPFQRKKGQDPAAKRYKRCFCSRSCQGKAWASSQLS